MSLPPVRLFVSYSHKDSRWFQKLRPLLIFDGTPSVEHVHAWHDNELKAGDRWDDEIRSELAQMDIFLCLVSYQMRASSYIVDVEKKEALNREKAGQTIIVPLMICDMADADIADLKPFNPLPAWGRSWRSYKSQMDAHKPIRVGLLDAVEKVRRKRIEEH